MALYCDTRLFLCFLTVSSFVLCREQVYTVEEKLAANLRAACEAHEAAGSVQSKEALCGDEDL